MICKTSSFTPVSHLHHVTARNHDCIDFIQEQSMLQDARDCGDRGGDLARPWYLIQSCVQDVIALVREEGRPRTNSVAKGTTSTGRGNLPSCATSLLESAMMITRVDADSVIFSRSRAPPPPLMAWKRSSISSAPSIVRSTALSC